jgi:hypothetical protein
MSPPFLLAPDSSESDFEGEAEADENRAAFKPVELRDLESAVRIPCAKRGYMRKGLIADGQIVS